MCAARCNRCVNRARRAPSESEDGCIVMIKASAPILRGQSHRPPAVSHPIERPAVRRSEEHTSELQSLMRISYAVFCLKKKKDTTKTFTNEHTQSQSSEDRHAITKATENAARVRL